MYESRLPRGVEIDNHAGVIIYFDKDYGKFEAKIGEKVISRSSLRAVKQVIAERSDRKITLMYSSGDTVVVTGKTPDGKWRREDGEVLRKYITLYEVDESVKGELDALREERIEMENRHRGIERKIKERLKAVHDMPPISESESKPEREKAFTAQCSPSGGRVRGQRRQS